MKQHTRLSLGRYLHRLRIRLARSGLIAMAVFGATVVVAGDTTPSKTVTAEHSSAIAMPLSPAPPDRAPPSRLQIRAAIEELARVYGLEFALVDSLVAAESAYDPYAISSAGALGLMQVMPQTARDYGVEDAARLFDVTTNLRTGMRHLRHLRVRYPTLAQAVMAYNAGTDRFDYPETIRYTHAVLSRYLRRRGIDPYSARAHALVGIRLTPVMARAGLDGRVATDNLSAMSPQTATVDTAAETPSRIATRGSDLATGSSRLSSRLVPRSGTASLLNSRLQNHVLHNSVQGLQGRALQAQRE